MKVAGAHATSIAHAPLLVSFVQAGGARGGRAGPSHGGGPRMYAARDDLAASAYRQRQSLDALQSVPLGERAQAAGPSNADKKRYIRFLDLR